MNFNTSFNASKHKWSTIIVTISLMYFTKPSITLSIELITNNPNTFFKKQPAQLALITEPNTLSSKEKMNHAINQINKVKSTIDFLSIRLDDSSGIVDYDIMLCEFLQCIRKQKRGNKLKVIMHHDENNMDTILKYSDYIDGIHVKERNIQQIPSIKKLLPSDWCIGTSLHSISSAESLVTILKNENVNLDYVYVGTCFETKSHPEKQVLEGPTLPGKIKSFFLKKNDISIPNVLAIGGISPTNCHIPMQYGADGVAVIRCIMQNDDPLKVSLDMKFSMEQEKDRLVL